MSYVEVISALALFILSGLLVLGIYGLVSQIKSKKFKFFRGYNYGVVALIVIPAFILYLVAYIEEGNGIMSVFSALSSIVEIIVLKYDTSDAVKILADENSFYAFTLYTCFAVSALNTGLLIVSLAWHYVWEHTRKFIIGGHDDVLVIYGLGEGSEEIYRSESRISKIIVDDIPKEKADKLYEERISYHSDSSPQEFIVKYANRLHKWDLKKTDKFTVVVNTGSDDRNLAFCKSIVNMLNSASVSKCEIYHEKLRVYVIGDPEYQSIYEDITAGGHGCVRYVNKYQRIAVDFIDKYPLSKFMTDKHIDTESALVRSGVDINVCFVGFGRVNREIFLTSIANNQFLEMGDGDPVLKKVKYHIFDKRCAENDKNLNHSYYRFKHECRGVDQNDYLPLPSLPAEEYFYRNDVNDFEFYEKFRAICTQNPDDVNFAVIAFGTDLENIDLAQKLVEKRREWRLDNLVIFTKAENFRKEDTLLEDDGCYFIGYEADNIYNVDNIISDRTQKMARYRNETYDVEKYIANKKNSIQKNVENAKSNKKTRADALELSEEELARIKNDSEKKWYMMSQFERDSNLYACLSIRSKLNLMGLDYVRADDAGDAISYEKYMSVYAESDMPEVKYTSDGTKPIILYPIEFKKSKRRNLAIHEHQRWNSFMLSRGMIPSTLEQIEKETFIDKNGEQKFTNGKNYDERRHGNLTTFEGLVRFRRILAEREKKPEDVFDVIKYDYQLLDEAYWLLTSCGYRIVRLAPTVKARFALPLQDQAQQIR